MSVTIQQALPNTAQLLSDLAFRSKAYWGYDERFMAAVKAELTYSAADIGRYPTKIACVDSEVVGFYHLKPIDSASLELEALFVDPKFIGRGLGARLFKAAVQQTKNMNFLRIEIQSDPFADNFYQQMGCVKIGEKASGSIHGRSLSLFAFSLDD